MKREEITNLFNVPPRAFINIAQVLIHKCTIRFYVNVELHMKIEIYSLITLNGVILISTKIDRFHRFYN